MNVIFGEGGLWEATGEALKRTAVGPPSTDAIPEKQHTGTE